MTMKKARLHEAGFGELNRTTSVTYFGAKRDRSFLTWSESSLLTSSQEQRSLTVDPAPFLLREGLVGSTIPGLGRVFSYLTPWLPQHPR